MIVLKPETLKEHLYRCGRVLAGKDFFINEDRVAIEKTDIRRLFRKAYPKAKV